MVYRYPLLKISDITKNQDVFTIKGLNTIVSLVIGLHKCFGCSIAHLYPHKGDSCIRIDHLPPNLISLLGIST
ncbi:hypothetical protein D3C81_956350 [compost metagenome]